MAERHRGINRLKPIQKLFAGLSATTLILLWWQLLSDIRGQHSSTASRTARTTRGTLITLENIKVRNVDLGPKVESLQLSIEAAELIYKRCSQATISTLEACFGELFDDKYYSSKTILPIAKALSLSHGQAKEVTYTLHDANPAEQWEGTRQGKFYCLNPILSSTEKIMWNLVTEEGETTGATSFLPNEEKNKICQERASF